MNGCRSDSLSEATVQYTKRVQWHFYPKGGKKVNFNHENYKQFNQILEYTTKKWRKKHSEATDIKLFAGAEII